MLTQEQKEIVKATVPVLKESGVALTTHFYNRMFSHNPELKNIFNMANQKAGKQQTALAMAVLAYAENIENPSVLLNAVNKIGHKHMSLGIRAEHYPIVGKHLIASIQEVLGNAATPELAEAWTKAYEQLADIFINHEASLYKQTIDKKGGWSGWRPFIVRKKVKESAEITSFYLYPGDGGSVADFTPGQYITVNVFLKGLGVNQSRQYSLSSAPNGEYYRISVKKEAIGQQKPAGLISNHLHENIEEGDMLEVSAPAGDFMLNKRDKGPVVLLSGGVGQTPLMSMLESLLESGFEKEIIWVHGCRTPEVHAFKKQVEKWFEQAENRKQYIFYDSVEESNEPLCLSGRVDIQKLKDEIILPDADYYICGPSAFIKKQYQDLISLGVDKNAIHYEEFGPHVLTLT
jgi:nitric oxide dioxygenase